MEQNIEALCRNKEQELLDKYFGNITNEAVKDKPENIGEYTKDLPLRIEDEYRDFLKELWKNYSDKPLVLEEQKLRLLLTEGIRERLKEAHKEAAYISIWERITRSNHEDVTNYKGILYEYTKELLTIMRIDFLEEITGQHIKCKDFERN